jgi:hypothetical protein
MNEMDKATADHRETIRQCCIEIDHEVPEHTIYVSLSRSMLFHYHRWHLSKSYLISYSKKPISQLKNSFGTPLGLHRIIEKYGDSLPLGTIMKGRVSTNGTYFDLDPTERVGHITTRILRLDGLQPGFNKGEDRDSYERYIYIHGTSNEEQIGQRISLGCILMKNCDIVELYDITPIESLVMIAKN